MINEHGNECMDIKNILISPSTRTPMSGKKQPESVSLKVSFLDITHTIEIINVKYTIKHSDIARFTMVTDCAFMQFEGKPILAIELRDVKQDNKNVKVVVAEARLAGKDLLLGFIVNHVEEFYKKLF